MVSLSIEFSDSIHTHTIFKSFFIFLEIVSKRIEVFPESGIPLTTVSFPLGIPPPTSILISSDGVGIYLRVSLSAISGVVSILPAKAMPFFVASLQILSRPLNLSANVLPDTDP